ncbi:MAG TPA: iron uptake transporter deferrochelatase/peroxidase subunit [Lacisediminihabitans sp.]|uniref:iron uptake transporter deferrochelatase/peroxidase subunit n=1 Tax=Lacisediminihabitans sp. TaxID=2787631 RepID=UPI002EDBA9ED
MTAEPPAEPADAAATGDRPRGISRRGLFLGTAGGVVGGAVLGGGGGLLAGRAIAQDDSDSALQYPFYTGLHQAGIETPPQRYSMFMAFDMAAGTTATDLQVLLARWSASIAQLMAGQTIGQVEPARTDAVAGDTGEALDLGPSGLTVTLGLGPDLFDARFGLAAKRPPKLRALPTLPSDQLAAATTGGELGLQACADDPQVAYHAIRDLARMARGTATTRWTVMGFGRASAGPHQKTPRNLMGFKDGTRNISTPEEYRKFVWVDDGPAWMRGGSYQVVRKIQMNIEIWDADAVHDQQAVFGRTKNEGAPLSGRVEHDTPDFGAEKGGSPVIPPTSHIALAAHENNGGVKILRRGYNYTDGLDQFAQLDAGLLFIAYMNDPEHFVRLQTKLGSVDRLNEYISHIGSALFAVPPAPKRGGYIGERLFS